MMVDLRRMRWLMNRIPSAIFKVEKARSNAEKITQTLSDMPHGSGVRSKVEDGYESIEIAQAAYDEVIKELNMMRNELDPFLSRLEDPNQRAVVRLRYMQGYRVRDIACMLYKCERQIRRYLEDGEKNLNKM